MAEDRILVAHRGSYKTAASFKMLTGIDLEDVSNAQYEHYCLLRIEEGIRETMRLGLFVSGEVRDRLKALDELRESQK